MSVYRASFQRLRHLYCIVVSLSMYHSNRSDGGDIRKQEKAERGWEESL